MEWQEVQKLIAIFPRITDLMTIAIFLRRTSFVAISIFQTGTNKSQPSNSKQYQFYRNHYISKNIDHIAIAMLLGNTGNIAITKCTKKYCRIKATIFLRNSSSVAISMFPEDTDYVTIAIFWKILNLLQILRIEYIPKK